ncbi:MAG: DNA/RNA non-specific endonuclease [Bacteroidales bacterium]|nr:DNA/RNA non-specific endonuclease [Bacteroidales bacterium]
MKKNKISALLLTLPLFACSVPGGQADGRLELPAIRAGEKIIEYSGYTDIAYSSSSSKQADPDKVAFTVSFDEVHRQPKWVAYSLSRQELGGYAKRGEKQFHKDPDANVRQADRSDYRRSGWTNGHMAPAGDFTWSDRAMNDTFNYTNICPQDEYNNGKAWNNLEKRVRDWARQFGEVYIVSGPIIGEAENGTIGSARVTVPDAFFKAVLARDGSSYQAVAFIMSNDSTPQPYNDCVVTVNELESIIGTDLFCALDDSVEEGVEGSVNKHFWGM